MQIYIIIYANLALAALSPYQKHATHWWILMMS